MELIKISEMNDSELATLLGMTTPVNEKFVSVNEIAETHFTVIDDQNEFKKFMEQTHFRNLEARKIQDVK